MIVCVFILVIQNLCDLKKEHSILSLIKGFSQTNEVDYGGIFNLIMLTLFCIFINIANESIGTIQSYIIESRLFREMLEKIMGASIPLFFEKTSSGKIINRFGDDLSTTNSLSNFIKYYISNVIEITMTLVYVSYYVPTTLFIVPVTIGLFILIMRDFMKVTKEMKRISRTVYSPIFTHLSESVDGVSTIRTYKKTHQFEDKYWELQDKVYIVNIIDNGVYNWLSFRLNIISLVFIAYYYVNWIYNKEGKDPIMISLMIGYLTGLPWRMSSLINDFISMFIIIEDNMTIQLNHHACISVNGIYVLTCLQLWIQYLLSFPVESLCLANLRKFSLNPIRSRFGSFLDFHILFRMCLKFYIQCKRYLIEITIQYLQNIMFLIDLQ